MYVSQVYVVWCVFAITTASRTPIAGLRRQVEVDWAALGVFLKLSFAQLSEHLLKGLSWKAWGYRQCYMDCCSAATRQRLMGDISKLDELLCSTSTTPQQLRNVQETEKAKQCPSKYDWRRIGMRIGKKRKRRIWSDTVYTRAYTPMHVCAFAAAFMCVAVCLVHQKHGK